MSRIGKKPILIPDKTQVEIKDRYCTLKGPLGSLTLLLDPAIQLKLDGKQLTLHLLSQETPAREKYGLYRMLIANMVQGVSSGFKKDLEIVGVGYRAEVKGKELVLSLGYSHPVNFPIPEGIKIAVEKQVKLSISGASKELVGEVAAQIRKLRKPEPYKGKGVKYVDEVIIRKVGKAAVGSGGGKGS